MTTLSGQEASVLCVLAQCREIERTAKVQEMIDQLMSELGSYAKRVAKAIIDPKAKLTPEIRRRAEAYCDWSDKISGKQPKPKKGEHRGSWYGMEFICERCGRSTMFHALPNFGPCI